MDGLNSRDIVRLIEWLEAQGFVKDKIVECLKYIGK